MKKSELAIVVGAGLALAAGGAYAIIPGADGVFHACYAIKGGAVRLVDAGVACKATEVAISWNQAGPQGPPGAQGPEGPQGPQGEPGSTVRAFEGTSFSAVLNSSNDSSSLSLGTLPAGTWIVNARARLSLSGDPGGEATDLSFVWCRIGTGTALTGDGDFTQVWLHPGHILGLDYQTVPLTTALTLAQPETIYGNCGGVTPGTAVNVSWRMTAIMVDELTVYPAP